MQRLAGECFALFVGVAAVVGALLSLGSCEGRLACEVKPDPRIDAGTGKMCGDSTTAGTASMAVTSADAASALENACKWGDLSCQ